MRVPPPPQPCGPHPQACTWLCLGLGPRLETCEGRMLPRCLFCQLSQWAALDPPHWACYHLWPLGHTPLPDFPCLLLSAHQLPTSPRARRQVESCLLTAGVREPVINTSVILSKTLSQERLPAGPFSPVGSPPLLCVCEAHRSLPRGRFWGGE